MPAAVRDVGTRLSAFRQRRELVPAELRNGAGLSIQLLENGSIFAIRHGDILVNQVLGSPVEGGLGNIYLRKLAHGGIPWAPLIGPGSASRFRASSDAAAWQGSLEDVDYSCTLRLAGDAASWFWTIALTNRGRRRVTVDAILAQDLGIANEKAVRTNELYTSQYIDHTVLEDEEFGFLVCSRQNLPQGGAFPWVMHGCLWGAAGYLTDGFQFHGLEYRATGAPIALTRRSLPSRVYQYEFALPTLASRPLVLEPGGEGEITFFAAFEPDHPGATSADDARRAQAAAGQYRALPPVSISADPKPRAEGLFETPALFQSRDLEPGQLDRLFGTERRHVEERDGTLLSFFHGVQRHVVLKAKELLVERPTGHIMRSGRELGPSEDTLSVTSWMFGVFASQVTIGNTSLNKLLSVSRNPLNVLKASGQRIFVRGEEGWELLGVPSAFEMGPTSARWIYHDERRTLDVRVSTSLDAPVSRISVEVERGGPIELLVSHNVVLGENEYDVGGEVTLDPTSGLVELRPAPDSLFRQRYPEATFVIITPEPEQIAEVGGDGLLYADGVDRGAAHVVLRTRPLERFSLVLTGSVLDAAAARERATGFATPSASESDGGAADSFYSELAKGARLSGATGKAADDLARLNDVIPWYAHNAMIHYTTPHGLEQYSGAAWAARDVSQGPVELLVATRNLAPLREVLRVLYGRQDRDTGDWPQWFMFDRYRDIQAEDSHGDIIHWPMKALCSYIQATDDLSILDEQVPYTDARTKQPTPETESIFAHTERQLATIERHCIPGTALVIFAGGDWEDTLQPADPEMARRLVSAWTVELAHQTLSEYRAVCERSGRTAMAQRLADLCDRIRADFNRHLLPDGIVAGLAHFAPDGIEYFLHPRDTKTGISYRLLPMSRGMLSGIFTPEQVEWHLALIERHLTFPDGVRLMNRPMEYRGGTSRYFRRAETAANFGREIGLQYVHAHIRYVEAMARIGRPEKAWDGLLAICPILIERDVPSALLRQSNAYFSSSDAHFMDRRQASRQFGRIKSGRVGVKGGWRVYSSGPGMYLNQLVSHLLGLRTRFDHVVIDPVLPRRLDGLTFDFAHDGRSVRYRYHVAGDGFSPQEVRVNGRPIAGRTDTENPYRPGGLLIARHEFAAALDQTENDIDIFI